MIIYHLLNGDSLLQDWKSSALEGQAFVWRECFCEGPLTTELDASFWESRNTFLQTPLSAPKANPGEYFAANFFPLLNAPEPKTWYLWFDNDLFCLVHLLAICHLLKSRSQDKVFFCEVPLKTTLSPAWWTTARDAVVPLDASVLKAGSLAWEAYTSPSPFDWYNQIQHLTLPFPQFQRNLRLHLSRLPHPAHGLNKPQEMAAALLAHGPLADRDLIRSLLQNDPGFGLGDALFRYHLASLPTVFQVENDKWNLTPFGQQVISRNADALADGFRPYAVGGVTPGYDNWRFEGKILTHE